MDIESTKAISVSQYLILTIRGRYNLGMEDFTKILTAMEQGDAAAADRLLPLVYDELRRLASAKLANEKAGHSLQPTLLVHEAYLRLVDVEQPQQFDNRGHFFWCRCRGYEKDPGGTREA